MQKAAPAAFIQRTFDYDDQKVIIMKRILLLILLAVLINGCSGRTVNQPERPDESHSASDEVMISEPSIGSSEEAAASQTTQADEDGSSLLVLWKKDITLQDPWVPTQDLGSFPYKEITVPASEAVPIVISVENMELASDQIDPALGEVKASYDQANMEDTAKEEYPKVWSDLKKYNEFARQNAIDEVTEGETRFKVYKDEDTDDQLSLISAAGIELKRSDSGIVSYFMSVHRINLGFEPDYYEVYGRSIDSSSGRVLTLNDILTDTGGLAPMIWDGLVESGSRTDSDPDKEAVIELLETAIQGCRDDGSFGWALEPAGIEFDLIESYSDGEKIIHTKEKAFIPFSVLGQTVRDGISGESDGGTDQ